MYRMARWAKPHSTSATPPLQTPDGFVSAPEKRALLLRDLLLGRFTSQNDVDIEHLEPGRGNLPWVSSVTDEEAMWITTACQNKAPGADAISVRLLRTAWPSNGHAVGVLFEGSLLLNYFPKAFKLAEVILLPKPGRNLRPAKG